MDKILKEKISMESKSVHTHFFILLIRLHYRKMFQIDVWSKGEDTEDPFKLCTFTWLLITYGNQQNMCQGKTVFNNKKTYLLTTETSRSVFILHEHACPQSNTIAHGASRWTRSPEVLSNLNHSRIPSVNYTFTFCRAHIHRTL